MTLNLPASLETYFAAANTDDADRIADCFTPDAIVRDEDHHISGRAAIRAWAFESRRKYCFHAQPMSVDEGADKTVVKAHLTGDFPGNPLDLNYRFTLADGKISALETAL